MAAVVKSGSSTSSTAKKTEDDVLLTRKQNLRRSKTYPCIEHKLGERIKSKRKEVARLQKERERAERKQRAKQELAQREENSDEDEPEKSPISSKTLDISKYTEQSLSENLPTINIKGATFTNDVVISKFRKDRSFSLDQLSPHRIETSIDQLKKSIEAGFLQTGGRASSTNEEEDEFFDELPPMRPRKKQSQSRRATMVSEDFLTSRPMTVEDIDHCSEHCRNEDSVLLSILNGDVSVCHGKPNSKIDMFFATQGNDTETERTYIMKTALQRILVYMRKHECQFELTDCKWGISDNDVTDDHNDSAVINDALTKCLQSNVGISFLGFITQKYGKYVLPIRLPEKEYQAIVQGIEDDYNAIEIDEEDIVLAEDEFPELTRDEVLTMQRQKYLNQLLKKGADHAPDPTIIKTWFKLDENQIPPAYQLLNVSEVYTDFLSVDQSKRLQAKNSWITKRKQILGLLQKYACKLLDKDQQRKYFHHVLSDHIRQGIVEQADTRVKNAILLVRHIEHLDEHLNEAKSHDYIDCLTSKNEVDRPKTEYLEDLRLAAFDKLPERYFYYEYNITWSSEGVVERHRSHTIYLDKMSSYIVDGCKRHTDFKSIPAASIPRELKEIAFETAHHVKFCHERARSFHGRREYLSKIRQYVQSFNIHPLVVHGENGCGLTSLMSKAACLSTFWSQSVIVITRVVGLSSNCFHVRTLLFSLCQQLRFIFSLPVINTPRDMRGLINDFEGLLARATNERPIIVFLDSIHQIFDENNCKKLGWLPMKIRASLPVRIIVSTNSSDPCFAVLAKELPPSNFLNVKSQSSGEAMSLLKTWLSEQNRTLSTAQTTFVEKHLPFTTPLYLRTLYATELKRWRSDHIPHKIEETIGELLKTFMVQIERKHNMTVVRRLFAYLSVSRYGLSVTEICDLLSLDEQCMNEVAHNHKLTERHMPRLIVLRALYECRDFLQECFVDGDVTLQIAHPEIHSFYFKRYAQSKERKGAIPDRILTEYFQNRWGKRAKLIGDSRSAAAMKRYVTHQPLFYEDPKRDRVFNFRRLNQLPYHMSQTGASEEMKEWTLCNFEWALAKIMSSSVVDLLEMCDLFIRDNDRDPEVKLFRDTLKLASDVLEMHPEQLGSQIVGRLKTVIDKDIPIAALDPKKYPCLGKMLSQARRSSIPNLIPSATCMGSASGMMYDLLIGHTDSITAACPSSIQDNCFNALTAAKDGCLKYWNLSTGRCLKTIFNVDGVEKLCLALEDKYAIVCKTGLAQAWSLETLTLVFQHKNFVDPAIPVLANESQWLALFLDGNCTFRVWDMTTDFNLVGKFQFENHFMHKNKAVVVADDNYGKTVFFAYRGTNVAKVMNLVTGKSKVLRARHVSGSIQAVQVAREYYILAVKYGQLKSHDLFNLELFEVEGKKIQFVRSIVSCVLDEHSLYDVKCNRIGSHAICICSYEQSNATDIAVWNLETEDHKHLAKHANLATMLVCGDLHYCLTCVEGESSPQIWNLTSEINRRMPKIHKKKGVEELYEMARSDRYMIAKGMDGSLSVWNVARGKCTGRAVRIEHGLSDKDDVMLVRNEMVIILGEKGFINAAELTQPVYQTMYVYDLRKKRYQQKLTGLYITPSLGKDYIIDDDFLYGLSDTRNHFMAWSRETGVISFRIRQDHLRITKRNDPSALEPSGIAYGKQPGILAIKMQKVIDEEQAQIRAKEEVISKLNYTPIDKFIVSRNVKIIVASFFRHWMVVFDLEKREHIQTLHNDNSILNLYVRCLTHNGQYLAHSNYDDIEKISYVTIWDCFSGQVRKRLKNERDVCVIGITNDINRVIIGKSNNQIKLWEPMRKSRPSLFRIKVPKSLRLNLDSEITIIDSGRKAVIFASDISLADLEKRQVIATFTADLKIQTCHMSMSEQLIVLGLRDLPTVVTLRLMSCDLDDIALTGDELFGEESSSDDEDDYNEKDKEVDKDYL